jgi:hypothetical protein
MSDKFEATMYVTAYELARDGLSDEQIGRTLGVAGKTFRAWCAKRPALADAVARGRHARDPGEQFTFHQYIYDHLSPHLRELWDEINECEHLENGVERIEALLRGHGIRARQHLFLYALTQSMFNVSQSLRKLGIPRKTFENWVANDPDFAELMDEIHWYKENFFEQAFIGRVAAGDTHAIIHAVKTKCRDRGYNEKIEVEHTGSIATEHRVSIVDLDLPVDVRRAVLDALREKMAVDEKYTEAVARGRAK